MASIRKTDYAIRYIKSMFANKQINDVAQTCQQCKHYGCAGKECECCRVFYVKTNFQDIRETDNV
jgi:hypothetical protein